MVWWMSVGECCHCAVPANPVKVFTLQAKDFHQIDLICTLRISTMSQGSRLFVATYLCFGAAADISRYCPHQGTNGSWIDAESRTAREEAKKVSATLPRKSEELVAVRGIGMLVKILHLCRVCMGR